MKIGIQTWGSHGDIRPYIALAKGFISKGHDVTFAITTANRSFDADSLSSTGVKIISVASSVYKESAGIKTKKQEIFAKPNAKIQHEDIIGNLLGPAEAQMFEASKQLCAENDIVIGNSHVYPLNIAAELSGCPYVSIFLAHTKPSKYKPPAGIPYFGSIVNRFLWWLRKQLMLNKLTVYSDRLRSENGLPPSKGLYEDAWASKQLTLFAVSPQVCERPSDWPEHFQVCGFFNEKNMPTNDNISDELKYFLFNGSPPIYMTFGSLMKIGNKGNIKETISLLRHAAEIASVRVIIQVPEWQKYEVKSNDSVYYVESTPHAEIFSLCDAVVHHGGAGTTHSALLAGKPSIVVAHMGDQSFWGHELNRLKVAPKPIMRGKLTADRLSRNIQRVVKSSEMKENARKMSIAMGQENGVATAIKMITDKFMT